METKIFEGGGGPSNTSGQICNFSDGWIDLDTSEPSETPSPSFCRDKAGVNSDKFDFDLGRKQLPEMTSDVLPNVSDRYYGNDPRRFLGGIIKYRRMKIGLISQMDLLWKSDKIMVNILNKKALQIFSSPFSDFYWYQRRPPNIIYFFFGRTFIWHSIQIKDVRKIIHFFFWGGNREGGKDFYVRSINILLSPCPCFTKDSLKIEKCGICIWIFIWPIFVKSKYLFYVIM